MVYNAPMFDGKRIGALILMGGEGRRFGSGLPKQFHLLDGKQVYLHTLEALQSAALFDEILLVSHPDWLNIEHQGARVVAGGQTRQESSYLGLQGFKNTPDIVLVHDGVRPFVSHRILFENVEGAIQWGAVDTCIPSADTLVYAPEGLKIDSIPNRKHFLRGQTPQTFQMDVILSAHEKALAHQIHNATDDCQLVLRNNHPIHIVLGEDRNIKITSELDLHLASCICCAGDFQERA